MNVFEIVVMGGQKYVLSKYIFIDMNWRSNMMDFLSLRGAEWDTDYKMAVSEGLKWMAVSK
jgi:hypothetical protein